VTGLLSLYPNAWAIWLTIAVSGFLLTGLLYAAAVRWNILMPPVRSRDVHAQRKPRIGGVAMWLLAAGSLLYLATGPGPGTLNFGDGVGGMSQAWWGIMAGLTVLLIVGLLDDIIGLSAVWQLGGQLAAGLTLVAGGVGVPFLRLPFWGEIAISPVFSALFVVVWVVVIINAVNLFDGLDGLAGSLALTASVFLFILSLRLGFVGAATLSLIVMGCAAGFLPWNWHPSKLFMGTVGSQLLGFLLATIAIISGAKVATAVLVLGIPLFDAVSVVVRRLLAGESPFKADQRHLHHRLLHLGFSIPSVVLITNLLAITFGILALSTQQANEKGMLTLGLICLMLAVITYTHVLERKVGRP
jgi:UDP-GlcNAc:undecaprenyl-phosphate/decaprenyl-phosphate GlcNAc-1-phosphate transferase